MTALADHVVVGEGQHTLLFLHGLGGNHNNWQPQLDAFANDYQCVAWTMPGFGTSSPLDEMTWPALADAAAALLDEVAAEHTTVIGLSMGGYIAQQLAVQHRDRIDRVVLAATSAHFGRGNTEFIESFLTTRLKPIIEGKSPADLAPGFVPNLFSDDAPQQAIDNTVASMSQISPDAYRRALECLVTWDFREQLSELRQPTLCMAGANDRTAPVKAMQALADQLPQGALVTIENCNHLMNLDHPDAFNAAIQAFLQADGLQG